MMSRAANGMMPPTFVVHAEELAERRTVLEPELARAGIVARWITDHPASAIDARLDATYFSPGAPLSAGQKSCALKHVVVMQTMLRDGIAEALVLEDDVAIDRDFTGRLAAVLAEAPAGADAYTIHLGSGDNRYPERDQPRVSEHLWRGVRNRTTEAYVVTRAAAAKRLDWIAANRIHMPIDTLYTDIDPKLGIEVLWAHPPLTEQGSLTGRFGSSITLGQSRLKRRAEFLYRKIRRWYLRGLPRR